jgi:chemotaxis signal transduction protein
MWPANPAHHRRFLADKRGVAAASQSYLTFRVARQDLALAADRIRGILPPSELVALPGVRPDLLGVATLKGQTVAVIDLGRKLGLPADASPGPKPKIVIVEVAAGAVEMAAGAEAATDRHPFLAGFMADRVCDVVVYRSRDLHKGMLRGEGRPRKLIDLARWVTEGDVAGLSSLSLSALNP